MWSEDLVPLQVQQFEKTKSLNVIGLGIVGINMHGSHGPTCSLKRCDFLEYVY